MQINRISGSPRLVGGYSTKVTYEALEDLPCFPNRVVITKPDGAGFTIIPLEKRSGAFRTGSTEGSVLFINGVEAQSMCDQCTLESGCSDKSPGVLQCRKVAFRVNDAAAAPSN